MDTSQSQIDHSQMSNGQWSRIKQTIVGSQARSDSTRSGGLWPSYKTVFFSVYPHFATAWVELVLK